VSVETPGPTISELSDDMKEPSQVMSVGSLVRWKKVRLHGKKAAHLFIRPDLN
jgi:hypothetical protein